MQLKLSASPKSPNTSASSVNSRVSSKAEEFDDYNDNYDEDDDIEDPESLNRTLSEIIEGKRSSSSLIAILNRENSDCDTSSVKSSGSENSSCSHTKLVKTNSFKGAKIDEGCEIVTVKGSVTDDGKVEHIEVPVGNCDSVESQGKHSAINQPNSSEKHGTQSIAKGGNSSNNAMQENQSEENDSAKLSNGNEAYDANENLHSKGAQLVNSDSNSTEQIA